ncbi:MAG: hypothetical protein H6728_09580 [Myxococcales bacterium]|nr:hypothetical protein [Myxococcales bacterium]
MTRKDSPSMGFFRLLLGIWIAWLLVAPRAGYFFAAFGLLLTIAYAIHTNTRRSIHEVFAWPTSNPRPSFFLGMLLFVGLSLVGPFATLYTKPNHPKPTVNNTSPQSPQSPTPSASSDPSRTHPSQGTQGNTRRQRPHQATPSPSRKAPVALPSHQAGTSTPPKPRTSRRVEAIRQALVQLEQFQKLGQEQQQLRERIQQGDKIAKDECQNRWKSFQPSIQAYQKRLDQMPDEVAMHARAAGQQLETCLGCGIPIDGKTYCGQMKAFTLDAKQAFKKLY